MSGMAVAGDDVDAAVGRQDEERSRVLRALLRTPVLRPEVDAVLFRLARRHADGLREWLLREVGWRLIVEPRAIRLIPTYVPTGPTARAIAARHAARARRSDPPFTRRRYVLLCLALAVLERSESQVSLGTMADEVLRAAHGPGLDGIDFTLAGRDERADLVAAIRLLLGFGVLTRVAGDEESYVASGGDALYDVDRRVLATMLAAEHSPALVAGRLGAEAGIDAIEAALHAEPPTYTDEEANRRLRHAISRRLLCDPVVYYDELAEPERAYLVGGQRVSLTRRLADATGLVPEMRAEGIALVDPEDQLTDMRMPDQGTDGHVALLLAEHLAGRGEATVGALRRLVKRLAREHASYWRKTTREPGAEAALVSDALARLVGLGLVRVTGEGVDAAVTPLPALARFAIAPPTIMTRTA